MLNKNKKEIERIEIEIEKRKTHIESEIKWSKMKRYPIQKVEDFDIKLMKLISNHTERIKTSILWCEDEIEFLNSIFPGGKYEVEDKLFLKCINRVESKIYQLQTHLTWLKEQEKEL